MQITCRFRLYHIGAPAFNIPAAGEKGIAPRLKSVYNTL